MALVLVIDDHADTQSFLCALLRRLGHRSLAADSGEAGLAAVASEKPDLIIVDGMMPGINGAEFIRLLRADPSTALIPAILYTAIGDRQFADNAMEKGANEVWLKGQIDIGQIRARVIHHLANKAAESGPHGLPDNGKFRS